MFGDDKESRRVVVVVSRTDDQRAHRTWRSELGQMGCEVVVIPPDELMDYMRERRPMDGVMLDDVYPPDNPEMDELARVLTSMRPQPRIAFLIAEYDDYHNLQHLVSHNRRVLIHRDGNGMMPEMYRHLAGDQKLTEPPLALLH
jgi:hypothetical protein